jgi:hypothetical protein
VAEISDETYRQLQRILEKQNGRTYSLEEIKEIGGELIDFFNLLIELDKELGQVDEE